MIWIQPEFLVCFNWWQNWEFLWNYLVKLKGFLTSTHTRREPGGPFVKLKTKLLEKNYNNFKLSFYFFLTDSSARKVAATIRQKIQIPWRHHLPEKRRKKKFQKKGKNEYLLLTHRPVNMTNKLSSCRSINSPNRNKKQQNRSKKQQKHSKLVLSRKRAQPKRQARSWNRHRQRDLVPQDQKNQVRPRKFF